MSRPSVAYRSGLTAEAVQALVKYDPDTGIFIWKCRASGRRPIGSVAGGLHPDGYRLIKICGFRIRAHWLAWLCVYGEWPKNDLDHINRRRDDNRIANLRECSRSENQQNRAIPQNKYAPGVYAKRGRYFAKIRASGQNLHMGPFATVEEAAEAYVEAKRRHHPFSPELRLQDATPHAKPDGVTVEAA